MIRNVWSRKIGFAASAVLLLTGAARAAQTPPAIVATCAACHGVNGVSVAPTFPDLAGQLAPYLIAQIRDFKTHKRADPLAKSIMWGMAATIPSNEIATVARYFASQSGPAPGTEPDALVEAGRKIFTGGIASTNTPACMACHGPNGQGLPPLFPRLAGQHAMYVTTQLGYFKQGLRTNGSSSIMQSIASKLTPKEIKEVAAFIRTL